MNQIYGIGIGEYTAAARKYISNPKHWFLFARYRAKIHGTNKYHKADIYRTYMNRYKNTIK